MLLLINKSGFTLRTNIKQSTRFPLQDMKMYTGCRGTSPVILNLSTRWRRVVDITLYSQERTQVSMR